MNDLELAFSDLPALRGLLEERAVSSVELTKFFLARLEKHGGRYNAVVTLLPERALREAERADRERAAGTVRSPLHGIPYGVKDLLAAQGGPTTWGAAPFRRQHFDFDATAVAKLRNAGAVLLAKLAMVELAGGFGYNDADASFSGPGKTPWNTKFWSGGSSSGSGAAVAAALVPFALGSETSGSILFPSTACGVTGLRPTYGRVSRHGAMALCWTLDKIGPIARSAADAQSVLEVIAGADPADPTSHNAPFLAPPRRPRIAVVAKATAKTMPAVTTNFKRTLSVLAQFADIVHDVPLPALPYGAAVGTIVNSEGAAAFRELIESGRSRQLRSKDDRIGGYEAYATLAVDYIDALRQRTRMVRAFEEAFRGFDAVAVPTLPTVTYPIGVPFDKVYLRYPGAVDLISPGNLVGWPAIGFPNGFGPNGLPTGFSLLGQPFGERQIAAIAQEYQRRTRHHLERPPVT